MRFSNVLTVLLACAGALVTLPGPTSAIQGAIISGPVVNPANGHSYYLLSQNDWTTSEAEATSLGGHLVTINDAAENAWVVSTFSNFGGVPRSIWIGLNDAAVEGTFVWANGEAVSYTNWGPGEPNNFGGIEDWAHIFPSTDGRFPTWNDAPNTSDAFGFSFHGVVEVQNAVPEPATLTMFGLGAAGLTFGTFRRRSRKSSA